MDRIVFEVVEFAEPEYPDASVPSSQTPDGSQRGAAPGHESQTRGLGPSIVRLARLVVIPAAAQQLLFTEQPDPLPSMGAPPGLLNFPGVTGMEAFSKGYLVLKSGCTFLESNGHDQLLAWPGGTHAAWAADGTLLLLDRESGVVAREGELIAMGGGQMAKPQKYFARHEGEIPEACLRNTIWQVGMELTTPRGEYRFPLLPWIG